MPSDHLRWPLRLRRQRARGGRMVSEGESAIEAFCLVRELGASADDGGTRKILDVSGTLRPATRRESRRFTSSQALTKTEDFGYSKSKSEGQPEANVN